MKYKYINVAEILPEELLVQIQKHVSGKIIYIPLGEKRLNWGEKNGDRHPDILWDDVKAKLELNPEKLWSLNEMELTGGEPDVVDFDHRSGAYVFCDCSMETPKGRRSICYDREGLESRKRISRRTMQSIWQLSWESNYYRKKSTGSYRLWGSSIKKHQAG